MKIKGWTCARAVMGDGETLRIATNARSEATYSTFTKELSARTDLPVKVVRWLISGRRPK